MLRNGLMQATLLTSIALLAAFAIACGSGDDDDDDEATSNGGGVQGVTIATSASELKFSPSELKVKAGEPVRIVLDNSEGTVLHDWSIEEMHVSNVHTEGGAEHMMEGDEMDGDHDDEDMPMDDGEEAHMDDEEMGDEDMHEMGMEGFALHIAADANTQAIIEFTPEEPGEYTFYCTVEGHRQAGMEGTLIVE